jgi:hypothetical protein
MLRGGSESFIQQSSVLQVMQLFRFLLLKEAGKEASICDVSIKYGDLLFYILSRRSTVP